MKYNSFFIKLLISLIILSVVPIIIIDTISNYAILKSSETEISNNSIGKLKVAENILSQLESTVFSDSVRLSVNSTINELSSFNDKTILTNGNNLITAMHAMNVLTELVRVNDKYASAYLYLDDFPYIFTTNNDLVKKSNFGDTGWIKYYKEFKNNRTILSLLRTRIPDNVLKEGDYNSKNDCVITHIYPLTPYTTNLNGALVVNIKEDEVSKLINSNNTNDEGYIFIISNKGEVISHPNSKLLTTNLSGNDYIRKIIKSKAKQGYLSSNIDGINNLVSYYKSNTSDWTFVGVFPIAKLSGKVTDIRMRTIYLSLFIMIMGILISFIITKRIYSPVKKLIKDIKLTKDLDINKNEDEMAIINKAFQTLIREDKALFDVLEKNKRDVKDNYLKNLLYGTTTEDINKSIIKEILVHTDYICAVISIDRFHDFTNTYAERQSYMKNFISQVADEVLKTTFNSISANLNKGEIVVLININVNDTTNNIQETLLESFNRVKMELSKVLENSITVGLGRTHPGLAGIKDSYFEALTALKQKLKLGYGNIIPWDEAFLNNDYYYPINIEAHIMNSLRSQSKDNLEISLDVLFKDLDGKSNLSTENIIQIFTQLVGNTIIRYLLEQNLYIYEIFGAKFNIYHELASKETIYEIKSWLWNMYSKIIEYQISIKCYSKNYLADIIEYISNNYRNDIGINDISEHVGLSYSHVRKIFKDELRENIIEYINKLRIKEAKHLLSNTNLSIKSIASDLGYNNDQSFTRFFKKYEGITPGDYRSK